MKEQQHKDTPIVNGVNGFHANKEEKEVFDLSNPPPFTIGQIRAAIPKHCFVKDPWRSLSYVFRDVGMIFALAAAALYFNSWFFWLFYWFGQGTMFWAMFVIGHDCGHGSFSNNSLLNHMVGHFLHSTVLVPYHGWRISHKTHHQNHANVEKDESWIPVPEKVYREMNIITRLSRYTVPFPMFALPYFLVNRSPGKKGSHFNPNTDFFGPHEWKDVLISDFCFSIVVLLLLYSCFAFGPVQVFKFYVIPYLIFLVWLDFVTYLHHHGHEEKRPWYRGKEWNYLRGAFTTFDRDYGWIINNIHHDVGTHVMHHLFPQIPHYHLVEATKAAKPILGRYYREPQKSGLIPFHLFGNLARSIREDNYVSDVGDIVYYQTDPDLYKFYKSKLK